MRTDGVNLSPEAIDSLRDVIKTRYGPEYLPSSGPRAYRSRAKNAQEAHEAIRPTNPDLLPDRVSGLTSEQVGLGGFLISLLKALDIKNLDRCLTVVNCLRGAFKAQTLINCLTTF